MDIVKTQWNVFVKQDGKGCFVINVRIYNSKFTYLHTFLCLIYLKEYFVITFILQLNVVPVLMDIAAPLESVLVIQATQDLLVKIVFQIQIVNMEPALIILLNVFVMMVLRAYFAQHQFARKIAILNM